MPTDLATKIIQGKIILEIPLPGKTPEELQRHLVKIETNIYLIQKNVEVVLSRDEKNLSGMCGVYPLLSLLERQKQQILELLK